MDITQKGVTPEFLRALANQVSDDEKQAKGEALWNLIQEEVGNELDRKWHGAVCGESQNTVKVVLVAEEGRQEDAKRVVSYRMGVVVNGRDLEAVVTIPYESALLEGRYAVMDALKASLAEQLAKLLLSDLQFSRVVR